MIGFGGDQMIDHIDGGGEKDLDVGIAGLGGDALGRKGFSCAGISNQDHVHALANKLEAQEIEDTALVFLS